MLDHVRLLNKRLAVVRISDVAQFSGNRSFIIDEVLLTANIFPDEPSKYVRNGAPPVQRNKILKVLHEMAANGVTIETSNIGLDAIAKRVAGEDKPSRSTVRDAVRRWEAKAPAEKRLPDS